MKAKREQQAKAEARDMASMKIGSYRAKRMQRDLEASSAQDARSNAKLQSELKAHADEMRSKLDKEAKSEMAQVRTEALRGVKLQRSFVDAQQREVLENDRLQSEMTNHVKKGRASAS
jgi:hypothetical protein